MKVKSSLFLNNLCIIVIPTIFYKEFPMETRLEKQKKKNILKEIQYTIYIHNTHHTYHPFVDVKKKKSILQLLLFFSIYLHSIYIQFYIFGRICHLTYSFELELAHPVYVPGIWIRTNVIIKSLYGEKPFDFLISQKNASIF